MDSIQENLKKVQCRIIKACERSHRTPDDITLVTVTKWRKASVLRTAFHYGIKDFGENRVQEAQEKIEELSEIRPYVTWHMVGHVQSNKAKLVTNLFDIVHSVDSVRLARILDQQAQKPLPVLLQVNVSGEATKQGFSSDQVNEAVDEINRLTNLRIKGLMTIAPLVYNPEDVRPAFQELHHIRDRLGLEHLSMGMTDDFEVAIEEGATIIRIGRAIFGDRR